MEPTLKILSRLYNENKNNPEYQVAVDSSDNSVYKRWNDIDDVKIIIERLSESVEGTQTIYTTEYAYDLWNNRTTATYYTIY